ncbi:MAG: tetratricopeptide repeat protein [Desulfobacteraceae bacterium]
MHYKPKHHRNRTSGLGWLIIGALLPVLLSGCGTSGASQSSKVRYGNPFYDHMRQLPENRPRLQDAQAKLVEPAPEVSAEVLERQGDGLLRQGKVAGAYTRYEQSLVKAPGNLGVQLKMARLLARTGFHDDALRLLDGITERQPDLAAVWEAMGMVYFFKKDLRLAREFFDKALSKDPNLWRTYAYLGHIHDLLKEHDRATQAFETAIRLQPEEGLLFNGLGVSLAMAGRHDQAVAAFRQAIRFEYAPPRVFNNLGASLAALGRYAEAFQAFKKGVGEARAHNNLGCMYLLAGDYEAAIRSFEKAIAITPLFYGVANDNLKLAQAANGA